MALWVSKQFSLGCNVACTPDDGVHVSERASISNSAKSKTIDGRRSLFFFLCLVRGGILKRFGFFIGLDVEQRFERIYFSMVEAL